MLDSEGFLKPDEFEKFLKKEEHRDDDIIDETEEALNRVNQGEE